MTERCHQLRNRTSILVQPEFTAFNFAAIADICMEVHKSTGDDAWQIEILSSPGGTICSNGRLIQVRTSKFSERNPSRRLFVLLSESGSEASTRPVLGHIKRWAEVGCEIVLVNGLNSNGQTLQRDEACTSIGTWQEDGALFPAGQLLDGKSRIVCSAGGVGIVDDTISLVMHRAGIELGRAISCRVLHGGRSGSSCIGHFERTLRKCLPWMSPFLDEGAIEDYPLRKGRLAAAYGVGKRQLERFSRKALQMPPMEVARTIRLHRAREYLLGSTMPVSVIANKTGFMSVSHFSKCFQKQFGQRPAALRRNATSV